MEKIIISSCLVGHKVRYNGSCIDLKSPVLDLWIKENRLIPFCSEISAGLLVPRACAEIKVMNNEFFVFEDTGKDVTKYFVTGAENALKTAIKNNIKVAVLNDRSPSCGSSVIYDGSFSGNLIKGQGITAALLSQAGIKVFSHTQLELADQYIRNK